MVRVAIALLALFWAAEPAFAQTDCPALEGDGIPSSPYQVVTLCQLQGIRSNLTAHYALAADIDASPTGTWNNGTGFDPIGSLNDPFSGSFVNNGNHVITGLTINRPGMRYVGLFSYLVSGAMIRGVILVDARMTGNIYVGSLVGYSLGTIEDSSATGSVSGSLDIGGLVGRNLGTISNGFATGSVSGQAYIGGLVGVNYLGSVRDSFATGSVSGRMLYIGGLVGSNLGTISNSYATGSVKGNLYIGGLVGGNVAGTISNGFATGSVKGNLYIGGLVGGNSGGTISNGFATGSVSGNTQTGDLVGVNLRGNVSRSYYYARGANNNLGEPRSIEQMRCPTMASVVNSVPCMGVVTYNGWNTNVWNFGSKTELPQLKNNPNSDLNRKPYIGGLGERTVRVAPETGSTTLAFEAVDAASAGVNATLTWSLSGLPPALKGFAYFDSVNGMTATTSGSSARLTIMPGAWGTEGTFFDVVLMNSVSVDSDRVRVRVVEAQPPEIDGAEGNVLNQDVKESASTALLTFTANVGVPGDHSRLQWEFLVDGEPTTSVGDLIQFDGSTQGASVSVRLERPGGRGDFGSFVLRVTDPVGPSSTFTVNIVPVCVGNGEDLMDRQGDRNGSRDSPYQIWARCQLQDMDSNLSAHYVLAADIDASPTGTWNNGTGFEPIGSVNDPFSGSFVNSNDYVITGLTIDRPEISNVGMFSVLAIGATIRGVILMDARTTGKSSVGSLVGRSNGTILDSSATGIVSGDSRVGSLVGLNDDAGRVSRSSATGTVSGNEHVGGLVGRNQGGTIKDSRSLGSVTGDSRVGGLVGENVGSIIASYATGTVTGTLAQENGFVGGLVGYSLGNISGSHATGKVVGAGSRVGGLVGQNQGGTIEDSRSLGSVTGGSRVGGLVGENTSSIIASYATGTVTGTLAQENGFVGGLVGLHSSGVISVSYAIGKVDGRGSRVGGLVGYSAGFVSNNYATGAVSGNKNVGGLVGLNDDAGRVSRSSATGTVSGNEHVGGLVGYSLGYISGSYATGKVVGTGSRVGGLVGSNNSSGRIIHSVATGPVSGENNDIGGLVGGNEGSISYSYATSSVSGNDNVGGLVGFHAGSNSISNNYATGSVLGRGSRVGGLVGDNEGTVGNSYATGSVWGGTTETNVGGLVGVNIGTISNSFATGSVKGNDDVGGLVGVNSGGNVSRSYYARGPNNNLGEPRSIEQMRCPTMASVVDSVPCMNVVTYNGWDTDVWNFSSETELPQLKNNPNPDLNRKPYIGGLGERTVRVAPETGNTTLAFEAVDAASAGVNATLTWSLSGLPPALKGFAYFDSVNGMTATASGSSARLTIMPGAWGTEGTFFDVVLMNSVSGDSDRVRVRVVEAQPPVIVGLEGNVLNQDVRESASTALLTFTADVTVPGDHSRLEWRFLVDGDPMMSIGSFAKFVGPLEAASQGTSVSVLLTRSGNYDVGSFVLRVTDPAGPSSTFTVNIVPVCVGNGEDLMDRQGDRNGSRDSPYQIWARCQLQDMDSNLSAHYVLAADIDASPTGTWNNGTGFEPIGSVNDPFSGSFVNSNDYVITGLTIDRPEISNVGMFSVLEKGATIRGVILVDARTTGNRYVGSLVGHSVGTIEDSSATGSVSARAYIGGLVGRNLGTISGSFVTGSVLGQKYTGGLVGRNLGTISNSYATGSVKGTIQFGGLLTIHIGGLAGYNGGTISNSYATGSVSGQSYTGGLVGWNEQGSVRDSFATGSVKGNDDVGGLVGVNSGGNVSRSYYARGPNNNLGEPRSIEQMRCPTMASVVDSVPCMNVVTYNGWDTDVWNFSSETELPQLKNNPNPDLNRKPYIGGLGERTVRVAPETGNTTLAFEAVDAASAGVNATLTWSLSGLPPALKGFAYFDSVNGMTATASGSSARLTIMPGAWGTEGTFFDVVLMNSVSGDSDRVRVRVVEAQPPVIVGLEGNVLNQDVRESASTALLTFTADVTVPGDHSRLEWRFLVDGDPMMSIGSFAKFVGPLEAASQGTSVSVLLTRSGNYDVGSFVLRVTDPAGPSSTFTVNIVPVCVGNGEDLMDRQGDRNGSRDSPYQIWARCQLQDMDSNLSAHYVLAADIDASPTGTWNNGTGFEPIGSVNDPFSGSFVNSNDYVITGLTIDRPEISNVGMFSVLEKGATIRGVILVDARTTGNRYVGSLVGHSVGTIEDSSATGSVSARAYIGGLVGRNLGTISNSYATGSVLGQKYTGGLVGRNLGTISNSYATGSVKGTIQFGDLLTIHIGGLAGYNGGTISNSYATGSVKGNLYTGGLVGWNEQGSVRDSFATGSVKGNDDVGGLVGVNSGGNVSRSYHARGANNNLGEPRSIEQMRCQTMASVVASVPCMNVVTYNGWDTDVWNFGSETELPQLKNNPNPDLNRKPYIGGLGERTVRVAPETGNTTLAFEAVDAASAGVNETLTWSLSGLPPALKGFAYFDSVNGMTATASGSSARLTIMPGAWGTEGTFFDVVLMNSVSGDSDRVRVRVRVAEASLQLRIRVYLGGATR